MRKWLGLGVAAAALLAGCSDGHSGGGGTGDTATRPTLRLANSIPNVALTLNAVGGTDSATFTSGTVASGAVSDYVSSTAQTYTVAVSASPASLTSATHT